MTSPTGAPGRLLVVATPIGNLEDLSPRALAALRDASLVLCEDTRRTGNLFARYAVTTPRVSCHEHNEFRRIPEVLERLAAGETLALVSDAGTPGVSDPGRLLAAAVSPRPATASSRSPGLRPSLPSSRSPASRPSRSPSSDSRRPATARGPAGTPASLRGTRPASSSSLRTASSLPSRRWHAPGATRTSASGRELTKLHEEVLRGTASAVAALLAKRPGIKGEIAVAAAPSTASALSVQEAPRSLPEDDDASAGPDEPTPDDDSVTGE